VRAQIEVTRLVALHVDPVQTSLALGATRQLIARADYDDGSTGVDATNRVSWSSEQPNIATVDDGTAKGLVSAVTKGVTRIRVQDPISGIRSDRSTGSVNVANGVETPSSNIVELSFERRISWSLAVVVTVAAFGVHTGSTREPIRRTRFAWSL
jgi:uncharacterized protein YjdB